MENSFTIHDLPKAERPRERLKALGAEALSSQELLALIIGRGVPGKSAMHIAQELLDNIRQHPRRQPGDHRGAFGGKGHRPAKAAQIKAAFELGRRQDLEPDVGQYSIKRPGAPREGP